MKSYTEEEVEAMLFTTLKHLNYQENCSIKAKSIIETYDAFTKWRKIAIQTEIFNEGLNQ